VRISVAFAQDNLYRGHVSLLASHSRQLSPDFDFLDNEFALEEPVPDNFHNVHGVAYGLAPSLDGALIGSTVEVHHYGRRVGHQRFLSDEHNIRGSPAYRTGLTSSFGSPFWNSFRCSFCTCNTFRFCFLHLQTLASLNPYGKNRGRFLRLKALLTLDKKKREKKRREFEEQSSRSSR